MKRSLIRKTTLKNGLTIVSERVTGVESVSVGIWAKVGTRHEDEKSSGMSHFLEHMLFKGTEHSTALQISHAIDRVGGEFNAFTTREQTCFYINLLRRDLPLALDILSEILIDSTFATEELERERKVILQEIAMVEENPEELALDLFFEKAFPDQGLGRPILGTTQSVRRINRKTLLEFFGTHYRPRGLVVVVVGQVQHARVVREVRRVLGKKHFHSASRRSVKKEEKDLARRVPKPKKKKSVRSHLVPGAWWCVRPTEQVHLVWGVKAPHVFQNDRVEAQLLHTYLGSGMSSLLFQEIRERHGLAYTVYSSYSPYTDIGVFTVYVGTPQTSVLQSLKLIEQCIARVCDEKLGEKELEAVKNNLLGSVLIASDQPENRMTQLGRSMALIGEAERLEDWVKALEKVTPEDLQRVARKLFQHTPRSLFCLGPSPDRNLLKRLKAKRVRF